MLMHFRFKFSNGLIRLVKENGGRKQKEDNNEIVSLATDSKRFRCIGGRR